MANAYAPTFTSLVAEVQDICENTNTEFVANLPNFIHRGQDQVQRDLGLDMWRTYNLDNLSTAAYARNPDWLIIRSIYFPASNTWAEKRHLDYVRMYGGSTGRPKVWAEDSETSILFAPAPDTTYAMRIDIYQRLTALVAITNESNWLTRNAGDLLLLQTLINAQSYLVSPERVQEFSGMYQAILPTALTELRESERKRSEPIRAAPRPTMQAGASA